MIFMPTIPNNNTNVFGNNTENESNRIRFGNNLILNKDSNSNNNQNGLIEKMNKKRILLPDLLKGLAALFMVQIHITELFINSAGRESMFGKVSLFLGGPFAAVVFMSVMGYFVAKNKKTFKQNILRGVKIFILGLLLNMGLNFNLLLKIAFAGWPYNPLQYILGVDILYLAGMSIIILAGIKTLKIGQKWISIILLLAVIASTGIMNEALLVTNHYYVLPFIAGAYSWSYFPLFPWLAYPLAGFIFAQHQEGIKFFFGKQKVISLLMIAVIAVLVLIFYNQGINTTIDLPAYYHHTFYYALWALGLTMLWILLLQLSLKLLPDSKVVNFFCWIGKNITLFYVIQWLIIGNLATANYHTQTINHYWYWFAAVFAISVVLTFLIEKSRFNFLRKI
jgi:uncharacterized membrane protein